MTAFSCPRHCTRMIESNLGLPVADGASRDRGSRERCLPAARRHYPRRRNATPSFGDHETDYARYASDCNHGEFTHTRARTNYPGATSGHCCRPGARLRPAPSGRSRTPWPAGASARLSEDASTAEYSASRPLRTNSAAPYHLPQPDDMTRHAAQAAASSSRVWGVRASGCDRSRDETVTAGHSRVS
jgi:hypothetical protein